MPAHKKEHTGKPLTVYISAEAVQALEVLDPGGAESSWKGPLISRLLVEEAEKQKKERRGP